MKKTFCLLNFLFLTSVVLAQNTSIGLRVGLNVSNINESNNEVKSLIGANFGAFITRSIHAHWGLSAELNFSMKGWEDKGFSQVGLPVDVTWRNNYLEVPIYANYYFLEPDSKFRPKLFAGLYGGYLITASTKFLSETTDMKNVMNTLDFGALLGGGLHYSFGGGQWLIFDIRYHWGLTNILKTNAIDIRNRNLSFNLGYSFPLGNTK